MVLVYCRPNSLELPAWASRSGLAAVAVVVAAVAAIVVAAAIAAAVAEQEQQNDDPPPVVAAEPVADAAVIATVITTHKNTSEKILELHRSFHGIPSDEKCADPKAALPLNNSAATGKQYLRTK